MKRKDIIELYLETLALAAAVILLAAVHFIFAGSFQLASWMIFGVVSISIVILRLENERLMNSKPTKNGGRNESFHL